MFSTILKRSGVVGTGNLTDSSDFWYGIGGVPASAGKSVSKDTAMAVWAVYACVSLISETLAQLPLKLKRPKAGGGKEDAYGKLYTLMKDEPNPEMTSFVFREMQQANLLGTGDNYAWIERSRVDILGLWPIPAEWVTVRMAKEHEYSALGITKRNSVVYDVNGGGQTRTIPARDMLHVRGFSFGGLKGDSVIMKYAKETIGTAIALDEFEGSHIKNGAHVSGVLEHPNTLGENKDSFLSALHNRYQSGKNTGTPMVLENGVKYNQFKVSLADQQFIEQKKLKATDICGIFKVPPFKIGIHGSNTSFNNTEQQNKSFLDTTMQQWLVRWEQAMNMKLLTDTEKRQGYYFKFNFDALLRPDAKTRAEINQIEWQQGVPINTLRERDDMNPIPGGDVGYVPLNFIPVSQAGKQPEQNSKRFKEHRASSAQGRARISKQYYPLIQRSAQKIVNFEGIAVKRQVKRSLREASTVQTWLDDFYENKVPERIKRELGPVFTSFAEALYAEASREIGGSSEPDAEFYKWIDEYIDTYSLRHTDSSYGQLTQLLADAGEEALGERVDEWEETRADKIALNETVRQSNAVAMTVFFAAGMGAVWRNAGSKTCPYCRTLNGKKISRGQSFHSPGDEIEPEGGTGPMKISGLIQHPPLHQGCDCHISAG